MPIHLYWGDDEASRNRAVESLIAAVVDPAWQSINLTRLDGNDLAQAAQAQEQLQNAVGSLSTNTSMAAFDQMEEKVLNMEARSQAAAELAGADLESQFASLEAGGDVDLELAAMKAQLAGGTVDQGQLPAAEAAIPATEATEVDAELEELRSQIDKLD